MFKMFLQAPRYISAGKKCTEFEIAKKSIVSQICT